MLENTLPQSRWAQKTLEGFMSNRTPDQAMQEYIERLGEQRGRFVKSIEDDIFNLRIHFEIYSAIFGTNKERVDLFNSVSGDVAYWIGSSMFDGLVLNVCRLTDPVEMRGGKRNVTVCALPALLSTESDSELTLRVQAAKQASEFARDWRNRRIAHSDEQVRLGQATLDIATRAKLRGSIDAIAACVRRYALVELGVSLSTHPIRQLGNTEISFLTVLYLGKQAQERLETEKAKLMERGEWAKVEELESLPQWLTFQPEQEFDLE